MPRLVSAASLVALGFFAIAELGFTAPARADLISVAPNSLIGTSGQQIATDHVFPTVSRREDVSDTVYTAAASAYPSVGRILFDGVTASGVLIAPNMVLTAGHVLTGSTAPSTYVFTINGVNYTGSAKTLAPTWTNFNDSIAKGDDIAILTLATNVVGVSPALLYTGTDELGRIGTNVGYGYGGTGLTGQNGGLGVMRAGDNVIDEFGSFYSGVAATTLLQDFDDPLGNSNEFGSAVALAHEGMATQGDSGGGLFVDFGNGPLLVGITSFLYDANGNGLKSDYGDVTGTTRVSAHLSFINSVVGVPEPGSFMLFGLGVGSLLIGIKVKRRREAKAAS